MRAILRYDVSARSCFGQSAPAAAPGARRGAGRGTSRARLGTHPATTRPVIRKRARAPLCAAGATATKREILGPARSSTQYTGQESRNVPLAGPKPYTVSSCKDFQKSPTNFRKEASLLRRGTLVATSTSKLIRSASTPLDFRPSERWIAEQVRRAMCDINTTRIQYDVIY